nr:MAG TPA: hypothetical protein [Caudoviricetes sp.]
MRVCYIAIDLLIVELFSIIYGNLAADNPIFIFVTIPKTLLFAIIILLL